MKKSNSTTSTTRPRSGSAVTCALAYFDARRVAFRAALESARSWYAVEGIHDLRVEVKKLRALFRLVEYVSPGFAAKPNVSAFKKLYASAGALRDVDIFQALTLSRLNALDIHEYFNQLTHDELHLRLEFSDVASRFPVAALAKCRARIGAALRGRAGQELRLRMAEQMCRLADRLNVLMEKEEQTSRQRHDVRKTAKTLRYTIDVWQGCYGKSKPVTTAKDSLRRTSTCLGEWRDARLALRSLKKFLARRPAYPLADPTAYTAFELALEQRSVDLLSAYERDRAAFASSLERLSADLRKRSG